MAERIRKLMTKCYHLTADLYELTRYHSGWKVGSEHQRGFPVYYLKGEDWEEWEYKICSPEFSYSQVAQGHVEFQNAYFRRAGRVFLAEKLQTDPLRDGRQQRGQRHSGALHLRDLQKCLEIFLPFLETNGCA